MNYTHQPKDIAAQLQLLQRRGLIIKDLEAAKSYLQNISFFRLSSYLRTFETDPVNHNYIPGTTFEQAAQLCRFDQDLRILIFTAIRDIELSLRTKIIQTFSTQYGPFWFMDSTLFRDAGIHHDSLSAIKRELGRSSEEFIKEYYNKYTSPAFPPVWKSLEVASFGTLSKLLDNFADGKVKKQVAEDFGLTHSKFLENWIQCAVVMRNACAHHGRVWNRRFAIMPKLPSLPDQWLNYTVISPNKIYWQLCVIAYLCDHINPRHPFKQNLKTLLTSMPNLDYHAMGFPENWQKEPLWQGGKAESWFKRLFRK